MKEFQGYDKWKTDSGYVHPDDSERVTAERVFAAADAVAPPTVDEINQMFDVAAQEQRNQAVPDGPRRKKSIWTANRELDELAAARRKPEGP